MPKQKLTDEQIETGAIVLAISNLGQDFGVKYTDAKSVKTAWRRCQDNHGDIDITEELKYWKKLLKKSDSFTINRVKEILTWW